MINRRKIHPALLISLLLAVILFITELQAQQQNENIIDLGLLEGGSFSKALAVNNFGQVAGNSNNENMSDRGFFWQDGNMIKIGTFGEGDHPSKTSEVYDINSSGEIIGSAHDDDMNSILYLWDGGEKTSLITDDDRCWVPTAINDAGQVVGYLCWLQPDEGYIPSIAVLWDNGTLYELGTLGGDWSRAFGINSNGQVVGSSQNADGHSRAFIWEDGTMTELETLESFESSYAYAINDSGQVVGWVQEVFEETSRAFLWVDGTMTDLGTLGGHSSRAKAINDNCQIVGSSYNEDFEGRPFLWEGGTMIDLGTLGGSWGEALDINDNGQVVGWSSNSEGQIRATLWEIAEVYKLRWVGPNGGDPGGEFGVAEHWESVEDPSIQRVPGPGDTIIFDKSTDQSYVITIDEDHWVGTMHVEQGMPTIHSPGGNTLTISPNGDDAALSIGSTPGSDSILEVVDGTIDVNGDIVVTDGELNIAGGGAVYSQTAFIGSTGGDGRVSVTQDGSMWSNSGELTIGYEGSGELEIGDGGSVESGYTHIGGEFGFPGEVTVNDDGSFMVVQLYVKGTQEPSLLSVTLGGAVEVSGDLLLGDDAAIPDRVVITGVGTDRSLLEVGGLLHIDGGASIHVEEGALASIGSFKLDTFVSAPATYVRDTGTELQANGELELQSGRFEVDQGGKVHSSSGAVGTEAGHGPVIVSLDDAGTNWTNTSTLTFGSGAVTIGGGASLESTTATVLAPAQVILAGGVFSSPLVLNQGGTIKGFGVIEGNVENQGGYVSPQLLPPATYRVSPESMTTGRLASEPQENVLVIEGGYEQSGGILEIPASGLVPGIDIGLLYVTGNAEIGGTIEIFFINDFEPREDDEFEFLEVEGSFTDEGIEVKLPNLLPGFEYETQFAGGSFGLTALNDGVVFAAPELISPAHNEENVPVNPVLNWKSVDGATYYRIQLALDGLFMISVIGDTAITQTSITMDVLHADTTYFWRLKAFGDDLESAWTPVASFVTGTAVSAEEPVIRLPEDFMLEQNYPNPFNPATTIRFALPEAGEVQLTLYDLLGRKVEVLVDEYKVAGYYETVFDAGHLSSGVYIYQLRAGEFVETKRLMLLK